jgi:hypothetical protein
MLNNKILNIYIKYFFYSAGLRERRERFLERLCDLRAPPALCERRFDLRTDTFLERLWDRLRAAIMLLVYLQK